MNTFLRTLLPLALLSATSCASIFSGTSDDVYCASDPAGAKVFEGDRQVGVTPCSVSLSRSTDCLVFEHAEHGRREVPLESSFQGGYLLLDILFTPGYGLVGILVDTMTQAWWDHPATVNCDFVKAPPAIAREKPARPAEERLWPGGP